MSCRKMCSPSSDRILVNFKMVIASLSELTESEINGTPEGRLALAVLKCVGEGRPLDWLNFENGTMVPS